MDIGVIGLGRMGMNMVFRLLEGRHRVVAYNRSSEKVGIAVSKGAQGAKTLEELVKALPTPRVVWMMVPAGQATTDMLDQLFPLLSLGDIVVDGGNSNYKDSMARALLCKKHKLHFLDIGVSGGVWGLKIGYCMMAGGEKKIFDYVEPLLKTLAPPDGYAYMGDHGSGHYVKMIHNGIEYALLQAYGEGFEILKAKKEFNLDLHKIAHLWNQGSVVRSWLLELAENALSDDPTLELIQGYVEDSGEGRWTVQEAIDQDVDAPTIVLSLLQRFRSRKSESFSAKFIAALRNQFGGHAVKKK